MDATIPAGFFPCMSKALLREEVRICHRARDSRNDVVAPTVLAHGHVRRA